MLGKNSADNILIFFFFFDFSKNTSFDLSFKLSLSPEISLELSCKLSFGDNLHAWFKPIFWENNK